MQAKSAGAQFALSPGFNPVIADKAKQIGLPFIPGGMTPSEIEWSIEAGFRLLKLFSVSQIGGGFLCILKALQGPFGHTGVSFIPMGGVNLQNRGAYPGLKNVRVVGGSWLVTPELIDGNQFDAIKQNAMDGLASITKTI